MSIEELEKRERDAYEAFMEADWMHADMRLNEWLDAAHELNEAKGLWFSTGSSAIRLSASGSSTRPTGLRRFSSRL